MKHIYLIPIKKAAAVLLSLTLFITTLILLYGKSENPQESITAISNIVESREMLLEDFSLFFLYPYIQDALIDYYGGPKQYWQDKIIDIRRVEINYRNFIEVTVQVETFEGAHNPPYGKDTITFRTKEYSTALKMIGFKHEDN
jgi:hypothetical protein